MITELGIQALLLDRQCRHQHRRELAQRPLRKPNPPLDISKLDLYAFMYLCYLFRHDFGLGFYSFISTIIFHCIPFCWRMMMLLYFVYVLYYALHDHRYGFGQIR